MNLIVLAENADAFREIIRSTIADLLPQQVLVKETDQLLTKEEACKEFDISKTTLSGWMTRGIVPFLRLGRRIYFERSKLMEAGRSHTKYQRKK